MKRVFPVIHLTDEHGLHESCAMSRELGAAGVFLINMGNSEIRTQDAVKIVQASFPGLWLGANFLGLSVFSATVRAMELKLQGVWSDYGVTPGRAPEFNAKNHPGIETFCAAAFKTQARVKPQEYADVAMIAAEVMDVVTTSGPGTGRAADLDKLAVMSTAVHSVDSRLAVASGVSPDNAAAQLEYVDDVLLATGIEKTFGRFDPHKLAAVVKIAQAS